jgi:hypothetical protein
LEGGRRGPEKQVIDNLLMTAGHLAQPLGQGEGHHKIRDGQQEGLLPGQPGFGVVMLTLGTMAISTGMIAVVRLSTMVTVVQVTAERGCATLLDGPHHLEVTGQHLRPIFLPIPLAVLSEDIGHAGHGKSAIN